MASGSKKLVLTAMIFAVSMTFIDQTIVSIAAPSVQEELGLTTTGMQWAINIYLLSLASMFAFGGRVADTVGHKKVVVIGVLIFATSSALCGLTPAGDWAQEWIMTFRLLQGVGGALLFPAALAIVVQTFPLNERGKALAAFFGVAGGLTALGPLVGGYLTEWTWRAIFWINIPVAIIALVLIAIAKPVSVHKPARMDYRGLVLIAAGIALSITGFQQSTIWGWSNPATGLCIAGGLAILVAFYFVEKRTEEPLIQMRIFSIRPFLVQNLVLFTSSMVFLPVFFFASEYAQISLGKTATQGSIVLLYLFLGFVVAAQIAGRMLDKQGAKLPVVAGFIISAVGFAWWASKVAGLDLSEQVWPIIVAGAGMGLILTPASTDAVNRASRLSYGEATGITQTVRNYAASLGLAVLGTVSINQFKSHATDSLVAQGMPQSAAETLASNVSQAQGGNGSIANIPAFIRADFADATQTIFYSMAGIMVVGALIAVVGLKAGRQEHIEEAKATTDVDVRSPESVTT